MDHEENTYSGWQLGNDWNDIVQKVIMSCIESMAVAHNDPQAYDEWYRSLEALRTVALFKPSDRKEMEDRYTKVENLMLKEEQYSSDLDLSNDSATRKKIDRELRNLQEWMIQTLWKNNQIVPKVYDTSWQPSTMRRKI